MTALCCEATLFGLKDNGGRRLAPERRQFSYDEHIPERRSGIDRRTRRDRRKGPGTRRHQNERRGVFLKDNLS